MKTLMILCLILFVSLAYGQKAEKLDRNAAAQVRAAIALPLPPNIPSISGGGLVVERETNGVGYNIHAVYSKPGAYALVGGTCNDYGKEVELGEFQFKPDQFNPTGTSVVLNTVALNSALPFFFQICTLGIFRVADGVIERSVVEINPWRKPASPFPVGIEGITSDGRYYVSLLPLPADAVVIMGRWLIAEEIRRSPTGSIAIFPQKGIPPAGPTTITICASGQCGSVVFERKLDPSGKG